MQNYKSLRKHARLLGFFALLALAELAAAQSPMLIFGDAAGQRLAELELGKRELCQHQPGAITNPFHQRQPEI